jgi:uncharacterized protein (DUF169 family)
MSFVFSMVVMLVVDDVSDSSPAFVFASTSADTSFSPSSLAACARTTFTLKLFLLAHFLPAAVVVVDKAEEKMPLLHAMALDASEKEDMCGVCVLCAQKSVE